MIKNQDTGTMEEVLQPEKDMLAAGYCMYGRSWTVIYQSSSIRDKQDKWCACVHYFLQPVPNTGNCVNGFTLDPSLGQFIMTHPGIEVGGWVQKKNLFFSWNIVESVIDHNMEPFMSTIFWIHYSFQFSQPVTISLGCFVLSYVEYVTPNVNTWFVFNVYPFTHAGKWRRSWTVEGMQLMVIYFSSLYLALRPQDHGSYCRWSLAQLCLHDCS